MRAHFFFLIILICDLPLAHAKCPWLGGPEEVRAYEKENQKAADLAQQVIENGGFTVTRPYPSYANVFGDSFKNALNDLKPSEHCIDLGSGDSEFAQVASGAKPYPSYWGFKTTDPFEIKMIKNPKQLPHVTAITFQGPDLSVHPKLNYLKGRYFNDIPDEEIIRRFGKAKMLVNLWGVLAYSATLSEDLNKILRISEIGAKVFITVGQGGDLFKKEILYSFSQGEELIPQMSAYRRGRPQSSMYNHIVVEHGNPMTLVDWLMSLSQFEAKLEGNILILTVKDTSKPIKHLCLKKISPVGAKPYPRHFVVSDRGQCEGL